MTKEETFPDIDLDKWQTDDFISEEKMQEMLQGFSGEYHVRFSGGDVTGYRLYNPSGELVSEFGEFDSEGGNE